ncbi:hypothetical protein FH969_11850 [Miniimonas arenae]|uniref:Uncharacterized protein n=1 Tax=Miniimonas arenae TaxID=676201 RepID=A0A5C5BBD3_9MICO|nr:hypothetical protein [Miniimonas arenae]TNU73362.1 hypothetical protein FH969_11850 [Miniimonas arenae]
MPDGEARAGHDGLAEALLASPAGRRMLAHYAEVTSVPGWWQHRPDRPGTSTVFAVFVPTSEVDDADVADDVADEGRPFVPPPPEPWPTIVEGVARRCRDVAAQPVDQARLCGAVARSVDFTMPWQEVDADDELTARAEVRAALRPVAEVIVASPAAEGWTRPLAVGDQRVTLFHDDQDGSVPALALSGLDAWAQAWHAATAGAPSVSEDALAELARSNESGAWWSTPTGPFMCAGEEPPPHPTAAPRTTPSSRWGEHLLGASELAWIEDSFSWREATLVPVTPRRTPRVFEVTGPDAWAELVRRFPLDVTLARAPDWYRHTGRIGRWAVPDWRAARQEYDAVHVTMAGYLTTVGLAVEVGDRDGDGGDGVASVLAGWAPDLCVWLTDVLEESGPRERWVRGDVDDRDHGWRRAEA